MKRIDEVKYLAEWISWSESEKNKEQSEDDELWRTIKNVPFN